MQIQISHTVNVDNDLRRAVGQAIDGKPGRRAMVAEVRDYLTNRTAESIRSVVHDLRNDQFASTLEKFLEKQIT